MDKLGYFMQTKHLCVLKPVSKALWLNIFTEYIPRRYFFSGSFVLFMSCVRHAFASVHCCFVVSCLERAGLLAFVCDVFVTFPCGILGQVWYLIVSIPDLCRLSYYELLVSMQNFS